MTTSRGRTLDARRLKRRLLAAASARAEDGVATEVDWVQERESYERELAKAAPSATPVRTERLGGVETHIFGAEVTSSARTILLLHGGGYTMGSATSHRGLAGRLAEVCDATVVVPHYRLAPEAPFPGGLEDARSVWDDLTGAFGTAAGSVALMGDSAGGGLAAGLMQTLLREPSVVPAALVLVSPWTDMTLSSPSMKIEVSDDPLVDVEFLEGARAAYLGDGHDPEDPRVSPLFGSWAGVPPTLIQVARPERLLDDARHLYARMVADGADVRLEEWDGLVHVWHQFAPALPEASAALERVGTFVRAHAEPESA